jgi:hypothetical protein
MVAGGECELSRSLRVKSVAVLLAGGSDPETATAGKPDCYRRQRFDKRKG